MLAIIGIISAIAIPALLGQRARARDKAALDNMVAVSGIWSASGIASRKVAPRIV